MTRSGAMMAVLALMAMAQQNTDSAAVKDFEQRVSGYVKLHRTARSDVHGLKPTNSPEEIKRYEANLANRIRAARPTAAQGDILTTPACGDLQRLVGLAMQGPQAPRIRESLRRASPVDLPSLRVNDPYPSSVPLQSTPPSLLLNLPPLPPEVDYRVVGHNLLLRDVDANLIVDICPSILP